MIIKVLEYTVILSVFVGNYNLVTGATSLDSADTRIVGGKIVNVKNYPYQVSLQFFGTHFCGGTLILNDTVLTAAHCCEYCTFSLYYYKAVVGSNQTVNDKNNSVQQMALCSIKSHEMYSTETYEHDICIMKLCSNVTLSENVQPIRISENRFYQIGSLATVSGWGYQSENGSLATSLNAANVSVLPHQNCVRAYEFVSTNMLCAGYEEGRIDACQGDSGGPLVQNKQIIGIVSYGAGCARKDFPGVYTNVAQYVDWIVNNSDYQKDSKIFGYSTVSIYENLFNASVTNKDKADNIDGYSQSTNADINVSDEIYTSNPNHNYIWLLLNSGHRNSYYESSAWSIIFTIILILTVY